MQTERFEDKTDDDLREMIKNNRSQADSHRQSAHYLEVQCGNYSIELDRRAVERLGLKEGMSLLQDNGKIVVIDLIGNYGAGVEHVMVGFGNQYINVDQVIQMRQAYLRDNPPASGNTGE